MTKASARSAQARRAVLEGLERAHQHNRDVAHLQLKAAYLELEREYSCLQKELAQMNRYCRFLAQRLVDSQHGRRVEKKGALPQNPARPPVAPNRKPHEKVAAQRARRTVDAPGSLAARAPALEPQVRC